MEPEAKYTLVGTVVLVLLVLLTVAFIWLKQAGGKRGDLWYAIYFEKQSLDGLQLNSDVKMKGIKVGVVSSFRISSRRPGAVYVSIRVDPSAPVRENTQAAVERNILTGLASILLINPSEDSPLLTAAPPGEEHPVITEGESEYQRFSQSITQMAERADGTMQRINLLLSDENREAFGEILSNLRRISAKMDKTMARLDSAAVSVGRAADDFRTLSASITKDAGRLTERYDALGQEARVTVRELGRAVGRIEQDLTRLSAGLDALVDDGNLEFKATAQELRTAADALSTAVKKFNEPGKIIFGPSEGSLGPGESLP